MIRGDGEDCLSSLGENRGRKTKNRMSERSRTRIDRKGLGESCCSGKEGSGGRGVKMGQDFYCVGGKELAHREIRKARGDHVPATVVTIDARRKRTKSG